MSRSISITLFNFTTKLFHPTPITRVNYTLRVLSLTSALQL